VVDHHLAQAAAAPGSPALDPSADGNWRILPVAGVTPIFTTGSGALRYLARHPGIALVTDNGDGSALFEIRR
jgi:2',3'-cyclic-nucleotide 2'-phosphodiesterase / 3'-nucleotidase